MRPYHFIESQIFPYHYVNVFQDDDRLVVRLLIPDNEVTEEEANLYGQKERKDLLTLDTLAAPCFDYCRRKAVRLKNLVKINDQLFFISNECFVDRRLPKQKRAQTPSSSLTFAISTSGDRTLRCVELKALTAFTKWNATWYIRQNNITVPFQIYIASPTDTMNDVCKSFVARQNGIICPLPMSKAIYQNSQEIDEQYRSSKPLALKYVMEAPETVKPNEIFKIKVVALHNFDQQVCEELTWDGFVAEPVDGYVPHRRVSLVNGRGEFKAQALSLEDGETMRVKFGKKDFTGLAECTVKIQA